MDLVNTFVHIDLQAHPDFPDLMLQGEGLAERGDRRSSSFLLSRRGHSTVCPASRGKSQGSCAWWHYRSGKSSWNPGGAKAAGKRHTVADGSNFGQSAVSSLPMITEQLTNITMRQDAMEKKVGIGRPEPVGFQMPSAGRAAVPVSSLLSSAGPKPSVSNLGALVGPPQAPCMKPPAVEPDKEEEADKEALSSPVTRVPLEQSRALSRLVAHFHAVGSDPMSDLSSAREKLQRELAQGSGQFFLQRRISPTSRPATSPSEIGGISLLAYLERYGGPRAKQRAWHDTMVARSRLRCYGQGRMGLAKDHLALTTVMVEQASLDNNKWSLAWASSPPRRCSSESLDFEGPNSCGLQASICSSLCSDMDDHSRGVSHRGGPADVKEERSTVRGQRRNQLRQPCAKTKPKAKAGERKGKPSAAVWPSGGDRMSPFHAGGAVDGMASGCFGGGSEAMSSLGTDCGDAGSFVSTGKRNAQFLGGSGSNAGPSGR